MDQYLLNIWILRAITITGDFMWYQWVFSGIGLIVFSAIGYLFINIVKAYKNRVGILYTLSLDIVCQMSS